RRRLLVASAGVGASMARIGLPAHHEPSVSAEGPARELEAPPLCDRQCGRRVLKTKLILSCRISAVHSSGIRPRSMHSAPSPRSDALCCVEPVWFSREPKSMRVLLSALVVALAASTFGCAPRVAAPVQSAAGAEATPI